MNKIFKSLLYVGLVAFSTTSLVSCIDETEPTDVATDDQIGQSSAAIEALTMAMPAYVIEVDNSLLNNNNWHAVFGYPAMMMMRDLKTGDFGFNTTDYASHFNHWSHNKYSGDGYLYGQYIWNYYWKLIQTTNNVVGPINPENSTSTQLGYLGAGLAYRALAYLDLARMYECLPAANDNNPDYFADQLSVAGLTVPIVDENLDEAGAKENPRATREQIFNFIFADLAFAEEALAEYVPTMFSNPDLSVVYGLYARAYLWLGGFDDMYSGELPKGNAAYAKAGEYARKAIEAHGGAIMSEAEWTSVTNGFNVVASSWMWGLQQSVDTVINNLFQFVAHMAPEASYGYAPLSQLGVSKKDYERLGDGDFRKKLIKGPETTYAEFAPYTSLSADEFASFAPYVNFKFRPAGGNRTEYKAAGATVLPLMRCEEMYFIEMEAAYHTQGFDAALTLLSSFMANRDSSYRVQTQDLLDEIIFQKGIEFWGEGIKMYDMKRLNKGYDSAYNGTNYPPDARFVIEGRAPWWSYCIPKGETDLNKAAAEQGANPNPSQAFDPILPME
jgi:hypothetical protein